MPARLPFELSRATPEPRPRSQAEPRPPPRRPFELLIPPASGAAAGAHDAAEAAGDSPHGAEEGAGVGVAAARVRLPGAVRRSIGQSDPRQPFTLRPLVDLSAILARRAAPPARPIPEAGGWFDAPPVARSVGRFRRAPRWSAAAPAPEAAEGLRPRRATREAAPRAAQEVAAPAEAGQANAGRNFGLGDNTGPERAREEDPPVDAAFMVTVDPDTKTSPLAMVYEWDAQWDDFTDFELDELRCDVGRFWRHRNVEPDLVNSEWLRSLLLKHTTDEDRSAWWRKWSWALRWALHPSRPCLVFTVYDEPKPGNPAPDDDGAADWLRLHHQIRAEHDVISCGLPGFLKYYAALVRAGAVVLDECIESAVGVEEAEEDGDPLLQALAWARPERPGPQGPAGAPNANDGIAAPRYDPEAWRSPPLFRPIGVREPAETRESSQAHQTGADGQDADAEADENQDEQGEGAAVQGVRLRPPRQNAGAKPHTNVSALILKDALRYEFLPPHVAAHIEFGLNQERRWLPLALLEAPELTQFLRVRVAGASAQRGREYFTRTWLGKRAERRWTDAEKKVTDRVLWARAQTNNFLRMFQFFNANDVDVTFEPGPGAPADGSPPKPDRVLRLNSLTLSCETQVRSVSQSESLGLNVPKDKFPPLLAEAVLGSMFLRPGEPVPPSNSECLYNMIGMETVFQQLAQGMMKYTGTMGQMPRGVLLYGPPGTGKTHLMKALSTSVGMHAISVPLNASDFARGYVGENALMVRYLASRASVLPWCVCYAAIDEIDGIAPSEERSKEQGGNNKNDLRGMLLSFIGGVQDIPNFVLLGGTNFLDQMDEALRRRLSVQVYLGLPDTKSREEWIELKLLSKLKKLRLEQDGYEQWASQLREQIIAIAVPWTLGFSNDALRRAFDHVEICAGEFRRGDVSSGSSAVALSRALGLAHPETTLGVRAGRVEVLRNLVGAIIADYAADARLNFGSRGVLARWYKEPTRKLEARTNQTPEPKENFEEGAEEANEDAHYAREKENFLRDLNNYIEGLPTSTGLIPTGRVVLDSTTLRLKPNENFIVAQVEMFPTYAEVHYFLTEARELAAVFGVHERRARDAVMERFGHGERPDQQDAFRLDFFERNLVHDPDKAQSLEYAERALKLPHNASFWEAVHTDMRKVWWKLYGKAEYENESEESSAPQDMPDEQDLPNDELLLIRAAWEAVDEDFTHIYQGLWNVCERLRRGAVVQARVLQDTHIELARAVVTRALGFLSSLDCAFIDLRLPRRHEATFVHEYKIRCDVRGGGALRTAEELGLDVCIGAKAVRFFLLGGSTLAASEDKDATKQISGAFTERRRVKSSVTLLDLDATSQVMVSHGESKKLSFARIGPVDERDEPTKVTYAVQRGMAFGTAVESFRGALDEAVANRSEKAKHVTLVLASGAYALHKLMDQAFWPISDQEAEVKKQEEQNVEKHTCVRCSQKIANKDFEDATVECTVKGNVETGAVLVRLSAKPEIGLFLKATKAQGESGPSTTQPTPVGASSGAQDKPPAIATLDELFGDGALGEDCVLHVQWLCAADRYQDSDFKEAAEKAVLKLFARHVEQSYSVDRKRAISVECEWVGTPEDLLHMRDLGLPCNVVWLDGNIGVGFVGGVSAPHVRREEGWEMSRGLKQALTNVGV